MKHNVVVVIPVYKQYAELSSTEQQSLQHTYAVLGKYDIAFVAPPRVDTTAYYAGQPQLRVTTLVFPAEYFTGLVSYSHLMLSLGFYERFAAYDYMLVCQPDVFVFSDQLDYFIAKGYDYIGAPWFEDFDAAAATSRITGVGNGGFSLRKLSSFLRVLYTLEVFHKPQLRPTVLRTALRNWTSVLRIAKHEYERRRRSYLPALPWHTPMYEDGYWGLMVKTFFPWFRVGSVDDAVAFAFEVNPRVLYELNQQRLPMATHAWEKYDPAFWKTFINL